MKKAIKGCILCKCQRAPLCTQQMEQMTPDKAPFLFGGTDYFGTLIVKAGGIHVLLKRYGCLFTCFPTRAVHYDVAQRVRADSFIAVFQRFSSQLGVPEKV